MTTFKIKVSPGKVLDRITILEIKVSNFEDERKIENAKNKLNRLKMKWNSKEIQDQRIGVLKDKLREVNEKLWKAENKVRKHEKLKEFDDSFIRVSRSVYRLNSRRTDIKKEINEKLESDIKEEKEYKYNE